MRIPFLLASAAALAVAACGNSSANLNGTDNAAAADPASRVDDKSLERQVMDALSDAPRNGLTRDLFLKGDLPSDKAQRREALLKIARDYASALADGKVDPSKLHDVYTIARPKTELGQALADALDNNRYRDWVEGLAPQTPEYRALSDAFVKLVQRSPDLPDQDIPSGKVVHHGESDPRIPAVRANLQALGYLPPDGQLPQSARSRPNAPNQLTPAISQALARFQADSGLKPDGILGNNTLSALNSGPRDRARMLAVAMERLRWLDRNPPATRIDVNTAASFLDYIRDGHRADQRKVIEGEPGRETPQLGAPIYQLVANPTWTVPHSIDDEINSKSQEWLASNNFTQKDGFWVQGSGPENSLGIVKFDMKDDQAIYLHDTPAKAIFSMDERHRSHGCVRVQDAIGFAHMLAQADGIDDQFSKAMATGDETFVKLNHEIPVRLLYHTAYLGPDDRVHYAPDVYGWDNEVANALGYSSRERAKVGGSGDIGP